jgi:hypothetical protein
MIGGDLGNVYKGRQGIQLATVLGESQAVKAHAVREAQKADQAKKNRNAALQQTYETKPDEVWHFYSAEANSRWNDWMNNGAAIMTMGDIENPWESHDPRAIQWRIDAGKQKAATDNINQYQTQYELAMKDIGIRGDEYTEEYKQAVRNFPIAHTYDNLAGGQVDFPQAQFNDPSKIYSKFYVKDALEMRTMLGQDVAPTSAQITDRVNTFFDTEENEAELKSLQQMYHSLPQAERQMIDGKAQNMGYANEPWKVIAHEDYESRFTSEPRNWLDDVMKYVDMTAVEKVTYSREDTQGVTNYEQAERMANKKLPETAAKTHFQRHSSLLFDETYMNQLGIDVNLPLAKRRDLAEKKFADEIRSNIALDYSTRVSREGGGLGKKEMDYSWEQWRIDIGGANEGLANQAAKYLFDVGGEAGIGDAVDAYIIPPPDQTAIDNYNRATGANITPQQFRVIAVEYKDAKVATKEKEKFYKEIIGQEGDFDTQEQEVAWRNLINSYKEQSDGSKVLYPVNYQNEQTLRWLHDRSAKMKGRQYERIGKKYIKKDQESFFFGTQPAGESQSLGKM